MKTAKYLLGLLLFAGILITTNANAQAIVDHESQYNLNIFGEFGLPSTYNLVVITPSGNYTFNLEWQLTEGNPYIPENGVYKEDLEQWLMGVYVTGTFKITPNGKCKIVLHGQTE